MLTCSQFHFRVYGLFIFVHFTVLFLVLFNTGATVHAQSPIGTTGLSLVSSPEFPRPNSEVTISIDDYSLGTAGAAITWYLNGAEQKNNKNERNISFTVGDVGEKSTIRVMLSRANMPPLETSLTIIPSTVDIILETNTYVPYFYRGRALPSGESMVRATAVVHDGTTVPDTAYTYKWTIGSEVFSGGPLTGKNAIEFELPHYNNGGLSVEVFNTKGESIGFAISPLTSVDPELHFYEYSPLRGLYQRELADTFPLIGEETTIFGEPYFLNAYIDPTLADFVWKIDGEETKTGEELPNAITLQRIGNEGSASVAFTAITKKRIPQFIERSIITTF